MDKANKHMRTRQLQRFVVTVVLAVSSALCHAEESVKAADLRREFAEPPLKYATRPLWFWNNTTVRVTY